MFHSDIFLHVLLVGKSLSAPLPPTVSKGPIRARNLKTVPPGKVPSVAHLCPSVGPAVVKEDFPSSHGHKHGAQPFPEQPARAGRDIQHLPRIRLKKCGSRQDRN